MKLEVGKLYACDTYHLLLYPDQETAAAAKQDPVTVLGFAASIAAYWSDQFGKPVSYVEKNNPILVLNSKKNFYEILAGDKKGWIIFKDWLKIKEIV